MVGALVASTSDVDDGGFLVRDFDGVAESLFNVCFFPSLTIGSLLSGVEGHLCYNSTLVTVVQCGSSQAYFLTDERVRVESLQSMT